MSADEKKSEIQIEGYTPPVPKTNIEQKGYTPVAPREDTSDPKPVTQPSKPPSSEE